MEKMASPSHPAADGKSATPANIINNISSLPDPLHFHWAKNESIPDLMNGTSTTLPTTTIPTTLGATVGDWLAPVDADVVNDEWLLDENATETKSNTLLATTNMVIDMNTTMTPMGTTATTTFGSSTTMAWLNATAPMPAATLQNTTLGIGMSGLNASEDRLDNGMGPDYNELLELDKNCAKGREEAAWKSVLLGASISSTLVLLFLLLLTKGKAGQFGVRLYCLNLALFAILQVIVLGWTEPDDLYGLHRAMPFGVRDFLNKYSGPLLEWSQIVFLSASTLLILDSIQKYRNNGLGLISTRSWLLGLAFLDLLPMVYIFVKGIRFEYTEIQPKPLAIYHVVVLLLFLLVGTGLSLAVFCVPFYRCCAPKPVEVVIEAADQGRRHAMKEKSWSHRLMASSCQKEGAIKPFTYVRLAGLLLFVMLAGWPQLTCFNLGIDLQPAGGIQRAKELGDQLKQESNNNSDGIAASLMKTLQESHIVYWLISIQQWSAHVRPLLETLLAILLLLLPSIGSKFKMRRIVAVQQSPSMDNSGLLGNNNRAVINSNQNGKKKSAKKHRSPLPPMELASAPPATEEARTVI